MSKPTRAHERETPSHHAVGPLDQYRRLIESLTDYAIFTLSVGGRIRSWNAGAEATFGYTEREVVGRHYRLIFTADDRANKLPEAELHAAKMNGKAAIDGWHVRKDGSRFWCTNTVQPFNDERGMVSGFTKIVKDSTEQHESVEALRESNERLRLLIEGATEYAIFSVSSSGDVTSWNSGAQKLYGYLASEILGKPVSMLYSDSAIASGAPAANLLAAAQNGQSEDDGWNVRKNKTLFFASGHTALLEPDADGRTRGFVKIAHDTTIRNDMEERMRRRAFHDELTALPNRASFSDYLTRSLANDSEQSEGVHFVVLYLDLDRFKSVNDRLGHAAGDELLCDFARLLERCSRPDDIVARIGGDEFTLLLVNVNTIKDAFSIAERIRLALRKPFVLAGEEVRMTASIGIAVGSSLYLKADDILRDADSAMYQAKARGGAQYVLFPTTEFAAPPVIRPALQ